MRGRRGFTLVELLIVLVMLSLIGAALTRILVSSMRVSQAQLVQADMQSNIRTGGLLLPLELREVGYDSNIVTNAVTSDLEAIGTNFVQFRAGRGFSSTCGTPTLTEWRIRTPVYGMRAPNINDGFQLYVENDPNTGADDQWVPLVVNSIVAGTCGADPALILTTNTPQSSPGVNLVLSQIFVGGPIRYYERMRFGSFVDADGRTYVGAQSISGGDAGYKAVAGPIDPATGLAFTYYAKDGTVLDPALAAPISVRSMDVTLVGQTRDNVNLAGGSARAQRGMRTITRIALRNTLKH